MDSVHLKVEAHLRELAQKMSGSVEVGFLEDKTYPDGTPVASVAFWNNYGTSVSPPRPFFTDMIEEKSPTWGGEISGLAHTTGFDGTKVLDAMGESIQGSLIASINDFTTPGNAASTIAKKGFDKPLIDTAVMVNSTGYRVIK